MKVKGSIANFGINWGEIGGNLENQKDLAARLKTLDQGLAKEVYDRRVEDAKLDKALKEETQARHDDVNYIQKLFADFKKNNDNVIADEKAARIAKDKELEKAVNSKQNKLTPISNRIIFDEVYDSETGELLTTLFDLSIPDNILSDVLTDTALDSEGFYTYESTVVNDKSYIHIPKKVSEFINDKHYNTSDEVDSKIRNLEQRVPTIENTAKIIELSEEWEGNDFYICATLLNNFGGVLSHDRQLIPIKESVRDVRYDDLTKFLIVDHRDGTTAKFDLKDLINGLITEVKVDEKDAKVKFDVIQEMNNRNYVSHTEFADTYGFENGIVKPISTHGVTLFNGEIHVNYATRSELEERRSNLAISADMLDWAVIEGISHNRYVLNGAQKAEALSFLGVNDAIHSHNTSPTAHQDIRIDVDSRLPLIGGKPYTMTGPIYMNEFSGIRSWEGDPVLTMTGDRHEYELGDAISAFIVRGKFTSKDVKFDHDGDPYVTESELNQEVQDLNLRIDHEVLDLNRRIDLEVEYLDNKKQDKLIAGDNIYFDPDNVTINAIDTTYTAAGGLTLQGTTFEVDRHQTLTLYDGDAGTKVLGVPIDGWDKSVDEDGPTLYYDAGSKKIYTKTATDLVQGVVKYDNDTIVKNANGQLEVNGGMVNDVLIDGASCVTDRIANIHIPLKTSELVNDGDNGTRKYVTDDLFATKNRLGLVQIGSDALGMQMIDDTYITTIAASNGQIVDKDNEHCPITPSNLDFAIKMGLSDNQTPAMTHDETMSMLNWTGLDAVLNNYKRIQYEYDSDTELPDGEDVYVINNIKQNANGDIVVTRTTAIVNALTEAEIEAHWNDIIEAE